MVAQKLLFRSIFAVSLAGFFILLLQFGSAASSTRRARHAMVVSAHPAASQIGLRILRGGGNAIDAAVAVGFALAVVYPEAGNIGGGGFMLIHRRDGSNVCVDFRETAPQAATSDMFLDSNGNVSDASIHGHRSVAVPGTVHGLLTALSRYGTRNLKEVIGPSIEAARTGIVVDSRLADDLADYADILRHYPSTESLFFRHDKPPIEGDTVPVPDLVATLERIEQGGIEGFYKGATASLIAEEMRLHRGILTEEDLASYHSIIREPLRTTYRGRELISIPLPSSGGTCIFEILNILEGYDLATMGFHSSRTVHLLLEAMKQAFADRTLLGDSKENAAQLSILLSKEHAAACRRSIDSLAAAPNEQLSPGMHIYHEGNETTAYAVADAYGNVVVVTYTLNDSFGSKVIVTGGGFFLNDEMDDFAAKVGAANLFGLVGGKANMISPGKRPLSSIAPVIVLQNNRPLLALGGRGGSRIISSVLQAIVNIIDFHMPLQQAIDAPRFHHQWIPDTAFYEPYALPEDVLLALRKRGHILSESSGPLGRLQAMSFDTSGLWIEGVPDWREGGSAEGY